MFENNFKVLDYRFNYMPDHFYLLKKKHPDIKFVIRGDHRPMGTFTTSDFLASFYYDWVPIVVIN